MQIPRHWHRTIVLTAMYVILLTTMILTALWKWHDSTNLLLHISLLTNFFLLTGLLYWFGERWKYFRITGWSVFMICCVFATIHDWLVGNVWGGIINPVFFLWGLYSLKEEIVKHMTHSDTPETSNEHFSGSEK